MAEVINVEQLVVVDGNVRAGPPGPTSLDDGRWRCRVKGCPRLRGFRVLEQLEVHVRRWHESADHDG